MVAKDAYIEKRERTMSRSVLENSCIDRVVHRKGKILKKLLDCGISTLKKRFSVVVTIIHVSIQSLDTVADTLKLFAIAPYFCVLRFLLLLSACVQQAGEEAPTTHSPSQSTTQTSRPLDDELPPVPLGQRLVGWLKN